MPVTQQENDRYRDFATDIARDIGMFDVNQDALLWHYTNGPGLLGILQSATLFATHVSGLNDFKETEFAKDLYLKAVEALIKERENQPDSVGFLKAVLAFLGEEPTNPVIGSSKFFVTCFSSKEDDVDQWLKYAAKEGPGRYAIGFFPRGLNREPNSSLFRVIYDELKLKMAATAIAEATLRFYNEGLAGDRTSNPR
jgi:hypothetical protein